MNENFAIMPARIPILWFQVKKLQISFYFTKKRGNRVFNLKRRGANDPRFKFAKFNRRIY